MFGWLLPLTVAFWIRPRLVDMGPGSRATAPRTGRRCSERAAGPGWPGPRGRRQRRDALALRLDGGPAGPSTVSRKRAILLNAVECAVARGHLTCSPLTSITWRAPKLAEAVDPRVVIDHGQAGTLFAAVRQLRSAPPLVAFFAVMYYAALRPGEAVDLRKEALALPESG